MALDRGDERPRQEGTMAGKSRVAVLRTRPETVLDDYVRLFELAGGRQALASGVTTILKDNISWHYPMPSANTTPWQLEGTVLALRQAGFADLVAVQNKTVVVSAYKGQDLNGYVPIFQHYGIPVLFNFRDEDMKWVPFTPKAEMLALNRVFPEGIRIPDYFFGKNIVHLPTFKCVAGDTQVMLANGSVVTVRDLVQRQLATAPEAVRDADGDSRAAGQVELLAMDREGQIRPFTATWFWRTRARGRRVLRLRTRTGRTLVATADHLIHTPEGWAALGSLAVGSRVGIARRLRVAATPQLLPQTFAAPQAVSVTARAGRTYAAAAAQHIVDTYQAGTTATAIAEEMGVRWQAVQHILKRHDVPIRRNLAQLRIPTQASPAFWRWLGYVFAEGCVERGKSSDKLWWVNSEPAIYDDFRELTHALFGLEAVPYGQRNQVHVYSRNLGRFLEEMGLPIPLKSGNKRVPEALFRSSDEEIAAFLSGYLDGDGSISRRQAELSATTKSERLARDLVVLFSRLGASAFCFQFENTIRGKWDRPRPYHRVVVSGDDLVRLSGYLHLRHPRKRLLLEQQVQRFLAGKRPSNWDTVPFSPALFRTVREGLGFTQASSGRPSSVNNIENGHGQLTPRIARYFVNLFAEQDVEGLFANEIARMRAVASEDLAWDTVVEVEDVSEENIDLYDITVPGADTFIGNGVVLHNCHIYTTTTGAVKNAFGGLLSHHRHYTHTWIHETLVDLLAIQKEIHPGIFATMDGTTAGNGQGPRTMLPEIKNVILASADQVAADAVSARMMGFDPLQIGYIRMAHQKGLGVGDVREIEIVGDADAAEENWHFHVGWNLHRFLAWMGWYGPTRFLQKLIFRTPIVNIPIFVSEFNHDHIQWPLRFRRIYEKWRAETPWGQLFQRYQEQGYLAGR
jgi:intein/homing endonuclease